MGTRKPTIRKVYQFRFFQSRVNPRQETVKAKKKSNCTKSTKTPIIPKAIRVGLWILSDTLMGSFQTIRAVSPTIRAIRSCGKSDGCMPRLRIGGIRANSVVNQYVNPQNMRITRGTNHVSRVAPLMFCFKSLSTSIIPNQDGELTMSTQ